MSSFAKVAIAAVAVVAVGTVGVIALRPGGTGNVGSAPSPTPAPTPRHADAHAYAGTHADAGTHTDVCALANGPTTDRIVHLVHPRDLALVSRRMEHEVCHGAVDDRGEAYFTDPSLDVLYDPAPDANLFVGVASQPLAGKTGDQWTADFLGDCPPTEPVTIDGAAGHMSDLPCIIATVTSGGRGYFVWLYTPDSNEGRVFAPYDRAWFEQLLATVDLRPEDAVDAAP